MRSLRAVLPWVLAALWAGLIFALSSRSTLPQPPGLNLSTASVIGHLVAYFVLSALLLVALHRSGMALGRSAVLAVALSVLYGLSDEWHQSFVPGRDAAAADLALDLCGATLAALAGHVVLAGRAESKL